MNARLRVGARAPALLLALLLLAGGVRSADDAVGDRDGLLALVAQLTDLMNSSPDLLPSGADPDPINPMARTSLGTAATQRSVFHQLADAIEEARGLLEAPHLELLGGMELRHLVSGEDGSLLQAMLAAAEEMEEGICKPPHLEPGERKPTACVGHNVTLSFQGGHCDLLHPPQHGVVCHPPRVVLVKTPAACTLKHTTPLRVVGKECKVVKEWGEAKQGYLLPPVTKSASLSLGDALATLQQRAGGAAASSAGSGPIGEGGLIGEGGRLRGRVASVLSALSALGQRLHRG